MPLPKDAEGQAIIPDGIRERIYGHVVDIASRHLIAKGPARLTLLRHDDGRWQDVITMAEGVFGDESLGMGGPYANVMITQLRNAASLELAPVGMYPLAVPGSYTDELTRSLRTLKLLPDGASRGVPDGYVVDMEQLQERGNLRLMSQTGSQGKFERVLGVLLDGDLAYAGFKPDEPLQVIVNAPNGRTSRVLVVMQTASGPPRVEELVGHKTQGASRPLWGAAGKGEVRYWARYRKDGKLDVVRLPELPI